MFYHFCSWGLWEMATNPESVLQLGTTTSLQLEEGMVRSLTTMWTEMVCLRPAASKWREWQHALHMGQVLLFEFTFLVASQAWRPHYCSESPYLVPFPEKFVGLWWRWKRPMHKVLEHPHRCMLEPSGHRLSRPKTHSKGMTVISHLKPKGSKWKRHKHSYYNWKFTN